jgi:hypothetical protein
MEPLSRALRNTPDQPWPPPLEEALGHDLDYPGYAFRLKDGTTVHAQAVNRKHGPGNVMVYRGYVNQPNGTRRDSNIGERTSPSIQSRRRGRQTAPASPPRLSR